MAGVFELKVAGEFCAAHRLDGYPGACSRTHGHNWGVEVFVQCRGLDRLGLGLDFLAVKDALDQELAPLDHADLNALPALAGLNPTAEVLARLIHRGLSLRLNGPDVQVARVVVRETPGCEAAYWEE